MRLRSCAVLVGFAFAAGLAWGAEPVFEAPMRGPWVPPAVRAQVQAAPRIAKEAATLNAEVEKRLRSDFDAAAVSGALTRKQASAAGLGFIAGHFDEIDARGAGVVRWEDYRAFLKARGGYLD